MRRDGVRIGETIPPDTRVPLQRLGLWERVLDDGHEPCLGSCSAWGSDIVGYNDFLLNPYGNGWHLDRRRFDALLLAAAETGGAAILRGLSFQRCRRVTQESLELRLVGRRGGTASLTTRFVVDASGSHAAFARNRGARRAVLDRLVFIYGFLDTSTAASLSRLTFIEATEDGWWYAAGLPHGRLAVAFATDPEILKAHRLTEPGKWWARLMATRTMASRICGSVLREDALVVRTAPSALLQPPGEENWLAVGDAAPTYDPLSSQGIHKALTDGIEAAEVIGAMLTAGRDNTTAYTARVTSVFHEYRRNRNHFYTAEHRWSSSPFWQRRTRRSDLPHPAPMM
jgi:flavin-dependent dehydrogenase